MADKLVRQVPIRPKRAESFAEILGEDGFRRTRELAQRLKKRLGGRIIWNVNSTSAGGGVAEMLHTLLAYARGFGVDTRWAVIGGTPDFFRVTKRLHHALHGERGDGTPLDEDAVRIYETVTAANAEELIRIVRPGDIAILHDPQTAGLIPYLERRGVDTIWRCHIGVDVPNAESDRAWAFLAPYLKQARAFVFSRFAYLPDVLYHGRCLVSAPSLDPFSPKNQELDQTTCNAILQAIGLIDGPAAAGEPKFTRGDGTTGTVVRTAEIVSEGPRPTPDVPLVVQVSRWDWLKDPIGVLEGFIKAADGPGVDGARLVLAGPSVKAVADDPEGGEVFRQVLDRWSALPLQHRQRVMLVNLPMDDLEENAAMVNALQRHAAVVCQKSLREGFGLTVTEAMWKARPVIASAVGGIQDQIEHGVSGLLLKHPADLDAFAGAIRQVLSNPGFAARLGRNARRRVTQNYLGLSLIEKYDDLVERLDHDPRRAEEEPLGRALPS